MKRLDQIVDEMNAGIFDEYDEYADDDMDFEGLDCVYGPEDVILSIDEFKQLIEEKFSEMRYKD